MKTLTTTAFVLAGGLAWGQYSPVPSSSYPALDANINSKLAHREQAGVPSGNCIVGKDVATNTSNGDLYWCTATNVWTLKGSGPNNGLIVVGPGPGMLVLNDSVGVPVGIAAPQTMTAPYVIIPPLGPPASASQVQQYSKAPGTGATAGAVTLTAGVVTGIARATAGTGYTGTAPACIIAGDGTKLATCHAVLGSGGVASIAIDSGGAGYTTATAALYPVAESVFATPASGGGGGITPSIITTYPGPPCNGAIAGQLFLVPTGAGNVGQCNGTATSWTHGGVAVTPPGDKASWTPHSGLTAVNNDDGSITISAVASSAAATTLSKTLTGKTSVTIGFKATVASGSNYEWCGIFAGDALFTSSGNLIPGFGVMGQAIPGTPTVNDLFLAYPHFDSRWWKDDFSAQDTLQTVTPKLASVDGSLVWLRLVLNGAALQYFMSGDGKNFRLLGSNTGDTSPSFTSMAFGCSTIGGATTPSMTVFSVVTAP